MRVKSRDGGQGARVGGPLKFRADRVEVAHVRGESDEGHDRDDEKRREDVNHARAFLLTG